MEYFLIQNRSKNSIYNNIRSSHEKLYSKFPFSHRTDFSSDSFKSKSMKKLKELQNEFQIEKKPNSNNLISLSKYKNDYNKKYIFNNYTRASINTNKLIRNSSMYSIKRNNIMILTTQNKSKYIPRNNSKIWRNIKKVKEKIQGNSNDNVGILFKNYLTKSDSKKYFYKHNNIKNYNPLINKSEKKFIFSSNLFKDNENNLNELNEIFVDKNKKDISTINSVNNSSYYGKKNENSKKSFFNLDDEECKIIVNNLNKL